MATHEQDDYLICREYQEQIGKKSSKHPGFITFKHDNGNHYFAWVNGDEIILRSEAYPDEEKMERGIAAILKNCDLVERYSVDEEHGAHFLILWGGGDHQKHTGNREQHSEIGRSCPHKTKEELNAMLQFKGNDFANKVVHIASKSASSIGSSPTNVAATTLAAATTVASAATNSVSSTATNTVNTTTAKVVDATSMAANVNNDASASGGMGWLKWLLPLLLLIGGIMFWKNCKNADTKVADTANTAVVDSAIAVNDTSIKAADTTVPASTASTTTTTAVVESMKVNLVNGVEINANKGGIESKLVTFLNDKNAPFNAEDKKANWYDFDNLNFDLGKATITKASQVQIDNLVAILKAYPTLKIKVGGYTDKKGDDAGNKALSQKRADAVVAALKAKGANADQLTGAEGYGEEFAKIAETASDEERRTDRRTAVRIVAR